MYLCVAGTSVKILTTMVAILMRISPNAGYTNMNYAYRSYIIINSSNNCKIIEMICILISWAFNVFVIIIFSYTYFLTVS